MTILSFCAVFLSTMTLCSMQPEEDAQLAQEECDNAFVRAIHNGDLAFVQACLLDNIVDVNCFGADNATGLMIAAEDENSEFIKFLLQVKGIDVNKRNLAQWSALDFAITAHNQEIVALLVQAGATLGNHLLPTSFCQGYFPTITTLMLAAWHGHPGIINILPKTAADINRHNGYSGQTPLMFAAQNNKLLAVTELISAGADINAADNDWWTTLMFAAWMGHESVVDCLLDAQARTDLRDCHFFRNALDWAKVGYRISHKASYASIIQKLQEHSLLAPVAPPQPKPSESFCSVM